MEMDRREFTAASVMALLSGVTVVISACGGGSGGGGGTSYGTNPDPNPTPAAAGDKSGSISDNHGHVATIMAAQITAAGAIVLNIQGNADHNHLVNASASEVVQIGMGAKVAKSSSTTTSVSYGSHDHTVTFNP